MRKLVVLTVALMLAAGFAWANVSPREHEMLVKVPATRADIPALQNAGLYVTEVGSDYVRGSITPSNAPALTAQGFRYEVLIPDMVQYAQETVRPQAGSGSFGVYHTYQQIMDTFNTIATNNPTICKLETLSRSDAGHYVIVLKITQDPTHDNHRPKMIWDGTTHGNENIGTEACWYDVQQLVGRYGSDPLLTQLVNTREIWIIPCFNPDGLVLGQRQNANGIDLNRENGYAWDNASGAAYPYSQAETQGMRRLFQREHFAMNLTYHSGATVAMWVWGWTDQNPLDVGIMSDQVTRYANTVGLSYGMISQVMYFAPGGSTDWNHGCEGSLGYVAEISTGQPPPANQIDTIAHANWTASKDLWVRAGWGIRGQVTDSISGLPVKRAIVITSPNGWMTFADTTGWYYRCAYGGSYSVKVMADGYVTKTIAGVTVPNDSWVIANVALAPDSTTPITGYKIVSWYCPGYAQVGAGQGVSVLGRHDGTSLCLSAGGWLSLEMSQPILNGAGTDFTVYSSSSKPCSVYVSADSFMGPWHFCAYGTGNINCDLTNAGVALAKYVRLDDAGQGYDLDAIEGTVVNAPAISYNGLTIIDSTGNSNGRLDPGEQAQLVVSLHNAGRQPANSVTGHLHCWNSYVAVNDSQGTFGTILPDSTRDNNSDRFTVTADPGTPRGTPADFTLYLQGAGYSDSVRFTIVVGQLTTVDPIPDGPRTPPLYYAYDDVDAAYPQHPSYNWMEINSIGTRLTYSQNDVVDLLNLPTAFGPLKFYGSTFSQISISADGWICPGNYTTSDYSNTALPDPSTPPGMICGNWDDLDPSPDGTGYIYWYHDTGNHRLIVEWDSVAYYNQQSVRDKFEVIFYDTTVVTPSGDNVIVVQYMTANGYTSSTLGIEDPTRAIAIQDLFNGTYNEAAAPIVAGRAIRYCTVAPVSGVADALKSGPLRFALGTYPNPLRGLGRVQFSQPQAGNVSLRFYSASGRLVRTLVNGYTRAGTSDFRLQTSQFAPGVYFLRLETESGTISTKAVLTR